MEEILFEMGLFWYITNERKSSFILSLDCFHLKIDFCSVLSLNQRLEKNSPAWRSPTRKLWSGSNLVDPQTLTPRYLQYHVRTYVHVRTRTYVPPVYPIYKKRDLIKGQLMLLIINCFARAIFVRHDRRLTETFFCPEII